MKKEEVCVLIDSEEKRLRALEVLKKADEEVWVESELLLPYRRNMFMFLDCSDNIWMQKSYSSKTVITLDQLEKLILPNYVVKDLHLTIEELKQQAEKLGFELVEKKREIKVGDFGLFYDKILNYYFYGFLKRIEKGQYWSEGSVKWDDFRHLNEEEKEQIQNNW